MLLFSVCVTGIPGLFTIIWAFCAHFYHDEQMCWRNFTSTPFFAIIMAPICIAVTVSGPGLIAARLQRFSLPKHLQDFGEMSYKNNAQYANKIYYWEKIHVTRYPKIKKETNVITMSCYYNHRLFQIPKRKFYLPRFLATMGGAYSHNLITSVFGEFHDVIGTKLCVGGQQQIIRHTIAVFSYIGEVKQCWPVIILVHSDFSVI